ncbi:MAG: hypothetical protein KC443_00710, partial [Anaerolineales bacterium]|nr:hypothetical protein [Anaerolineales bacterium]
MHVLSEHMGLEPAEETPLMPAVPSVAPCGQVITAGDIPVHTAKPTADDVAVYHAKLPNGKTKPILKTLLTSACERNCFYCPFRAGRNFRRVTFKPEEMAQTFMDLYRAGVAEGLFLSSGIIGGGVKTQDKLIATAELLRQKHRYRGYLHLKIMPGA